MEDGPMRASLIVVLLVIGLVAAGLRVHDARCDFATEVAYAEPLPPIEGPKAPPAPEKPQKPEKPERKGNTGVAISRGPQTPPAWKAEITGEFKTSSDAARKNALDQ